LQLESLVNGASYEHQRREADPFNTPAQDGGFEVFILSELATLKDGDRVDDAQAPVELSAGDVVAHTLSSSKAIGQAEEAVNGRTCRQYSMTSSGMWCWRNVSRISSRTTM
jgi:hypothetical protein